MSEPRVIVALSGGKASAYCAKWAFENYPKERILLYFNDTKWEHPDLYRFIEDIAKHFNHKITYDSDGRSPEQLFYDNRALANNRMPFCSRILKAERLQKFYKDGDILVFGIGAEEPHRGHRLVGVYQLIASKTGKYPVLKFPLVIEKITPQQINAWLKEIQIDEPALYKLGFIHNNCSGGCVRAGKKQWKMLYEKLPEVYLEREKVEEDVRRYLNKDVHLFKDETLKQFRKRIENNELSAYYDTDKNETISECIGVCSSIN